MKSVLEAVPPIARDEPVFNGLEWERILGDDQPLKRGMQQMVKGLPNKSQDPARGEKYEADTATPRPRAESLA